jgi:hypothetical protein
MVKDFYWYRVALLALLSVPVILYFIFGNIEVYVPGFLWYVREISYSSSNKNLTSLVLNYYLFLTPLNIWLISKSKIRPAPVEINRNFSSSIKSLLVYAFMLTLILWPMTRGAWSRFGDDFRILGLSLLIYGYIVPQIILSLIKVIWFLILTRNSDSEK